MDQEQRRIVVIVPATGQKLEASGLLAEMVMLLFSRADLVRSIRRDKRWRLRFLIHPRTIKLYGPDRYDDAAA